MTRCFLEHQSNFNGQFWTLTFSDEKISILDQTSERELISKFIDALQARERRAKTGMRVRYFGTCEYGELFGRPHMHMLIWNCSRITFPETVYRKGLPRPRYHIAVWPYGHIDAQPINLKSVRYVCKYVTKFNETEDKPPISFYPQRPKLGLHGLSMHVAKLSKLPTSKHIQKASIELEGAKLAFPPALYKDFNRLCWNHGMIPETDPTLRMLAHDERAYEDDHRPYLEEKIRLEREAKQERLYEWGTKLKEQKDARAYASALRSAVANSRSIINPSANNIATLTPNHLHCPF